MGRTPRRARRACGSIVFETATKKLKSGSRAVVPGNAKDSELLARIFAEDESDRMPPKSAEER